VTYNLAGVNNLEMGWGRSDETFAALAVMSQLGGEDWFRLGDRDLPVHLRRTDWLRQGLSLTEITDRLRRAFGVPSSIVPMCDQPVRSLVHTDEGDLPFQHYFVRRHCEPLVMDVTFVGAPDARLTETVEETIASADVIVFCPSNPYLSIDPILSIPGLRRQLRAVIAPKVAVSPIVGGKAIKGPAAKMMREMSIDISPLSISRRYADLLNGFVLDETDAELSDRFDLPVLATDTLMTDLPSKTRLAHVVLDFALQLPSSSLQSSLPSSPAPAQHRMLRKTSR
jgi:LPPG:FO 2-phospho-L-lactate transferase